MFSYTRRVQVSSLKYDSDDKVKVELYSYGDDDDDSEGPANTFELELYIPTEQAQELRINQVVEVTIRPAPDTE
jgi:hypothetical protein